MAANHAQSTSHVAKKLNLGASRSVSTKHFCRVQTQASEASGKSIWYAEMCSGSCVKDVEGVIEGYEA
jgi:hypothetical protein